MGFHDLCSIWCLVFGRFTLCTNVYLRSDLNKLINDQVYDETLNVHSSDSVVSVNGIPVQSVKQVRDV